MFFDRSSSHAEPRTCIYGLEINVESATGGFEPFSTDEDEATGREILQLLAQAEGEQVRVEGIELNRFAPANRTVLDVIRVDPDRWLVGYHRSEGGPSGWVGGVPAFKRKEVISRAYYKLEEALRWSELPMSKGDRVVELGAAPGGACQALLERGLKVIGVDPAMVDASLLEHANFSHWRKRSSEIRKRDLAKTKWLVCDSNNAPQHTLDSVKEIATNQHVSLRGLVLTLKLPEWKLAGELDQYAAQVASWGYDRVRFRHLAFNRQEICLVADQPTDASSSDI